MRHSRTASVLTLAVVLAMPLSFSAATVGAQPPPAQQTPPVGPRGFDVDQRVAELTQRLQLDATQAQNVRVILTDAKNQMQALRASGGPPDGTLRERRRAILFQAEDRIWALLSCTQKDAFRLYVREQMTHRFEHRTGRGGGRGHAHGPGHGRGPHGPNR